MSYNPLSDKFLTIATVKTKNGQKDVRVILEIDTNIFYTLDDDGNFVPIAYSLTLPDIRVTGATYSDNTFIFTNNTGGTFTTSFNTLTGLTINGDLSVTGNTLLGGLTATTISATTINGVQANLVSYDNTNSGLNSINVQNAIDELNTSTIYPTGTTQTFLKSNSYQPATGLAVLINSLRGYHISIDKNVTIKDLRVRFSAGVSGSSVYGIYNVDLRGYPTNLIYSTTTFNNNLTSQQVYTQDLSLTKGNYFVAYNSNSAPTAFAYFAEHLYNPIMGTQTTLSSSSSNAGLGVVYNYTGTLPTTFPAGAIGLGNVNHLAIIFRI